MAGCHTGWSDSATVRGCTASDGSFVMARFKVEWTEELWFRAEIEADSKEDAYNKLFEGNIDYDIADAYDGEIQDSVEIEEVA